MATHPVCSRGEKLAVLMAQLGHWNRDVVLPETDESARTDDHEGDGSVRSDDEVINGPDLLLLLVVDGLAKDLPLGTPAERHGLHLLDRHAEPG